MNFKQRFPQTLLSIILIVLQNPAVWAAEATLVFPTTATEIVEALTSKPKQPKMRGYGEPQRGLGDITADAELKTGALIHFNFDSAQILPQSQPLLHEYGKALLGGLADATLIIAGHTDSVGSDWYNLNLSQRRAQAVKDFLMFHYPIAGKRLTIQGYGESQPIDTNETEPGRAKNRRVEFIRVK